MSLRCNFVGIKGCCVSGGYYKIFWFHQLSLQSKLALVKSF